MSQNLNLSDKELKALLHIRNRLFHGQSPSVRDVQQALGYLSPRSAATLLGKLFDRGLIKRREDGRLQLLLDMGSTQDHAQTVGIPLLGSAPCGTPLLAEENWEATIPVSTSLAKPPHRYFFLRARGQSMNEAGINSDDLVLVRQQQDADNGDRVVALVDGEATIKEFHRTPDAVALRPRSNDNRYQPIIVTEDFQIQGVIVSVVPCTEAVSHAEEH